MRVRYLHDQKDTFAMLGLHKAPDLARQFGLHPSEETTAVFIKTMVADLVKEVGKEASGIILEPQYGYDAIVHKPSTTGISFEIMDIFTEHSFPTMLKGWGVEQSAANYAPVTATLPYHPGMEDALERKKMVFELNDYCHYEHVDFILNLELVGAGGGKIHPDELAQAQLQAVQELRTAAQLFILDFPGSSLASATLTAELDTPWLVRTAPAQEYESFKNELRQALEGGAKGFLASDPLWLEISKLRNPDLSPGADQIIEFLKTTLRDRFLELTRITHEAAG